MGLSIHYTLHSPAATSDEARALVDRLRDAAAELGFFATDVFEGTPRRLLADTPADEQQVLRILLAHAGRHLFRDDEIAATVEPDYLIAFLISVGDGSEPAQFGLCRYPATCDAATGPMATDLPGWHWHSATKTQYASNPEHGGLDNFVACHTRLVALLDKAAGLGLIQQVIDEGNFWQNRDGPALAAECRRWNQSIAAFAGMFKDRLGDAGVTDVKAEITKYPDYEHLEAEGRKHEGADDEPAA